MSSRNSPGKRISPKKSRKHIKKARRYLRADQRDKARVELRSALEHLPDADSPVHGLRDLILDAAEIATGLDGSAQLAGLLGQHLDERPKDMVAWVGLVRLLKAAGKVQEAIEACENGQRNLGGGEELRLLRAELLITNGSHEEGLAELWHVAREGRDWRRALQSIEEAGGSQAEIHLLRASRLRGAGDLEGSLKALDEVLEQDPRSVEALRSKAQLYMEREQWEHARTCADSALDLESTHFDLWDLKALAEERLGNYEEAVRSLQVSLRYGPGRPAVLIHLGTLLLQLKRYDHAGEVFEEAASLAKGNLAALEGQRAALAGLRRWGDYRELCRRIVAVDPTREDVLLDEAKSWVRSGDNEEAGKILVKVLEGGGSALETARKAAMLAMEIESWEVALEASNRVLSRAPRDAEGLHCNGFALRGLGQREAALKPLALAAKLHENLPALRAKKGILKSMGRWKGVYQACEQIVSHEPQDVKSYVEMAAAAEALGKSRLALQAFDKGLGKVPGDMVLLMGRAGLLSRLGRHGDAFHVYDEALKIDPASFEARKGRAYSLYSLRSFEEAIAAFDEAIRIREDLEVWYHKGLCLMEIGRFQDAVKSFDKAGELKEEGRIWMAKGNALLGGGNPQEALYSFDKALKLEPDDDEARLMRAECYMELGDFRMALQGLEQTLPRKADDWRFLEARVRCLRELGRQREAYDVAVELSEVFRKDPRAWTLRAAMARTLGLGTEALECLEKAVKLSPDDPAPKLEEARLLLSLEEYPESMRVSEEVIRRDRENVEAQITMAEAFAGMGRYEDALRSFNEALSLEPENKDALVGRALNLARLRRHDEAMRTAESLLRRSPSDSWSHYWKARVLSEAQRWEEALKELNQALYYGGSHPTILAQKGLALMKLERTEEGLKIVSDALTTYPLDPALGASRVALLKALGRHAEAIDHIDAALSERREDRELLFQKVEALEALNRWDEAVEALQRAAHLSPPSKDVWTRCSSLYLKLGQPEAALAAYDKAIELDPGSVGLWKGRGQLCETLLRWEDAVHSYSVALDISSRDESLLCALGRSYLQIGLYERARDAYARALAFNPTLEEALVGRKQVEHKRREKNVKAHAWNVLEFEAVNARRATKEEAFKYCSVPVEYLDEVVKYINEPPSVDVLSLPDAELRRLEVMSRDVLSVAGGSRMGLPSLYQVVNQMPQMDVDDTRRVLGYVRGVLELDVPEEELPGMERLMKMAVDFPREQWDAISLARNFGLGAYEAKRLEQSLKVFEGGTTTEPTVEAPPQPVSARRDKSCIKHGAAGIYQHICGQYLCSACIVGGRCPVCRHPVSRSYRDLQTSGSSRDEGW